MTALIGLARRGLLYLLLLQLGLMSLGWNLLALPLRGLLPVRLGTRVGRAGISAVYRIFWATADACGMLHIEASCLDALDHEPGALIVAANHPTMLDAMVIAARLRRSVCIMKAELMRNAFLGPGARLARYIGNDSHRGMVRCSVESLRDGGQLVMFPEGTRTVTKPVNPFRPGISLIAKMAQVPIQCVLIETDTQYLRKGWPIWRAPKLPIVIRVRLGQRFAPEADHQALLQRLERYFIGELAK